jgi:two-component system OmpR family sensor kinase
MKQGSIYRQFSQKLILATTFFIIVLSLIFYGFTKATIYQDISNEILNDAKLILAAKKTSAEKKEHLKVLINNDTSIDIILLKAPPVNPIRTYTKDHTRYIELIHPIEKHNNQYLKLTKNINSAHVMLNKIFGNLLFVGIGGFIMIILYALAVSKTLLNPIINITNKLSNMNENSLTQINTKKLPIEFEPLANSINTLTTKIESYVKYQKELFIGAAHELKTPLAVMRLKSQVTLARKRDTERYEEVLKLHIDEIDGMNQMISSILDMGRQEGAQFEKPVEINIIDYLKNRSESFKLLAKEKNITLEFNADIETFITFIQPTLLTQIIQNFVQNAIKFTPEDKHVQIDAHYCGEYLTIEVIDEGIGCDESVDLFAPFKRVGKEKGAGLGLFLAKSAADTLGGSISLKNRKDGTSGTIATLKLQSNPTCKIT